MSKTQTVYTIACNTKQTKYNIAHNLQNTSQCCYNSKYLHSTL